MIYLNIQWRVGSKTPDITLLYLLDLIPDLNRGRETRHSNNIPAIHTRHNYFKNSFFPSTISEWKFETQEVSQFLKRTC